MNYKEAKKIVDAYERDLLNTDGKTCYILFNIDEDIAIVVDDEDFAQRLLEKKHSFNQMKTAKFYSLNE